MSRDFAVPDSERRAPPLANRVPLLRPCVPHGDRHGQSRGLSSRHQGISVPEQGTLIAAPGDLGARAGDSHRGTRGSRCPSRGLSSRHQGISVPEQGSASREQGTLIAAPQFRAPAPQFRSPAPQTPALAPHIPALAPRIRVLAAQAEVLLGQMARRSRAEPAGSPRRARGDAPRRCSKRASSLMVDPDDGQGASRPSIEQSIRWEWPTLNASAIGEHLPGTVEHSLGKALGHIEHPLESVLPQPEDCARADAKRPIPGLARPLASGRLSTALRDHVIQPTPHFFRWLHTSRLGRIEACAKPGVFFICEGIRLGGHDDVASLGQLLQLLGYCVSVPVDDRAHAPYCSTYRNGGRLDRFLPQGAAIHGMGMAWMSRRKSLAREPGQPGSTLARALAGHVRRQWKMWTAPLNGAESSAWLPPTPCDALASPQAPTASVSPASATLPPNASPVPVLDAFT
jgi:hypothetical protein